MSNATVQASELKEPEQRAEEETSLLDIALTIKGAWRILVAVPLLIGLVTFGLASLITPTFTASTQLMVPQQQQSAAQIALGSLTSGLGALGSAISGVKSPADQWIGLLKSRSIADALIKQFGLRELYKTEYQFQAVERLSGSTRVTAGKDGLIKIEFDDRDPERAARIANAYVQQLEVLSKTLAVTAAGQRRLFFEGQLKDASEGLIKAELALNETGISASVIRTSPDASVTEVSTIKAQVAAQEVRLSVMRGYLTEGSPEYQQAQRQLDSLKAQLGKAAQNDPGAGAGVGSEYVRRYREFKYSETLFELLSKQFELAKVDEANDGAVIQVVDVAQVPEWKSGPKRGLLAVIGGVAGMILSLLFVLLRQSTRRNANPETAEKMARLLGRTPSGSA